MVGISHHYWIKRYICDEQSYLLKKFASSGILLFHVVPRFQSDAAIGSNTCVLASAMLRGVVGSDGKRTETSSQNKTKFNETFNES